MTDRPTPDASETPGGLPQEPVEDRPNVGTVSPDDYPDAKDGAQPLDEDKEYERRNPGSGSDFRPA